MTQSLYGTLIEGAVMVYIAFMTHSEKTATHEAVQLLSSYLAKAQAVHSAQASCSTQAAAQAKPDGEAGQGGEAADEQLGAQPNAQQSEQLAVDAPGLSVVKIGGQGVTMLLLDGAPEATAAPAQAQTSGLLVDLKDAGHVAAAPGSAAATTEGGSTTATVAAATAARPATERSQEGGLPAGAGQVVEEAQQSAAANAGCSMPSWLVVDVAQSVITDVGTSKLPAPRWDS